MIRVKKCYGANWDTCFLLLFGDPFGWAVDNVDVGTLNITVTSF